VSISSITPRSVAPPQGEGTRDFSANAPANPGNEVTTAAAPSIDTAAREGASSHEDTVLKNPTPAQLAYAVKQVNDAFVQKGQNLYASIEKDKETGINVVKLLDKNTKEVVRQYPTKEMIAIAAAITQYQESKGQLLDVSA
jgi:flagellar protein FlaG